MILTLKRPILILLFTSCFFSLYAQNQVIDSISSRFMRQSILFPQEKIYVQTDKPYYIAGETIWFRAHLSDAMLHTPDTTSRYIYTELINPKDSLIRRVKTRLRKGAYGGYIDLPEDMAEGEYEMRSYTRFMENIDDNYFFKRKIRIGDPLSVLYRTNAAFGYKEDDREKVEAQIRFTVVDNGQAIVPEKIYIKDEKGRMKRMRADKDSVLRFSMKLPAKAGDNTLYLEYDYLGKFHKEFIPIYIDYDDFHVDFFPEGGSLISGSSNRVAFKALNRNGLGEDITGEIINEKGDTLSVFNSEYKGTFRQDKDYPDKR